MPKRYVVPVEIEELDEGEGYLAICPVIEGCHAEGARSRRRSKTLRMSLEFFSSSA